MLDHIPETPSIKHCKTYVEKWHNTQTYEETDNALHLLFIELFPNNDSMSGVLLKTSALNDFYTTNIFNREKFALSQTNDGFNIKYCSGESGCFSNTSTVLKKVKCTYCEVNYRFML